jgi:hypothetical protein
MTLTYAIDINQVSTATYDTLSGLHFQEATRANAKLLWSTGPRSLQFSHGTIPCSSLATELEPPDGRWEGTRTVLQTTYPWQRRVHERNLRGTTARMQTALAVVQEFVHCLGAVPRGMCNQGSRTGYGKRERLALTGPGMQVSDRACFKDHLTCN